MISKEDVKQILERQDKLESQRSNWHLLWQDCAEIFLPRRASFTKGVRDGEALTNRIYDSAPMIARRGLSSALDGMLKPKTHPWFSMVPREPGVQVDDEARLWLDEAERRLRAGIYNARARFIERSGEVDDDIVTFGTGCLYIGTDVNEKHLVFKSYHLRRVFIAENSDGLVDTVHVVLSYSARQALQKWGDKIGEKVKEALNNEKDQDKSFDFLWVVKPRDDAKTGRDDNVNFPFMSVVIGKADENVVEESGFREFPFAVPRWDTSTEELYGRSPAMLALPDSNTLQAIGKTLLVAGQKSADPPMFAASDSIIGTPRTFPGGITYFDPDAASLMGGRAPIFPMETGAKIPVGREMQNDLRMQLKQAFFLDILHLPLERPEMTATEVLERKEDFLRTMGPVFGRLESDYIAPVVERSFKLMWRAGQFPPLPESLDKVGIKFEYASPLERARKQFETAGFGRIYEILMPLASVNQEILDNFDGDAIARDSPETFGLPQKWIKSLARVQEIRQARQEQAMMAYRDEKMIEAAGAAPRAMNAVETAANLQRGST